MTERSQPDPMKHALGLGGDTRWQDCAKHGQYLAKQIGSRNIWTRCPACAEEYERKELEQRAAHEEQVRKVRMVSQLLLSGLVGRMRDSSFESFAAETAEQKKALQVCRDFAATAAFDGGGGLWLVGPPGTGKTHLGSAMVNHVIRERRAQACIHSGREIVRMLRASWGQHSSASSGWGDRPMSEEEVIEHLGTAALLVIDEIGAGMGTDAERAQLFEVIDLRYKLRRPTIVLSNLVPSDMKAVLGERSYSRLRERSRLLRCDWEDYRGRTAG